jgi:hypothetical protein
MAACHRIKPVGALAGPSAAISTAKAEPVDVMAMAQVYHRPGSCDQGNLPHEFRIAAASVEARRGDAVVARRPPREQEAT